jgi:hypothetical protein
LLEMWLFTRVFLDVNGQPRPRWSEIVEAKLQQIGCDQALTLTGRLGCSAKSSAKMLWQYWLERGLPMVKGWLQKRTGDKK